MVKLGLLEQGKTNENINSLKTIEHIIDYAIAAEKKGFSRFWLTEHHYSFPPHPYTNPDILISIIAGMTEKIKIGSAGVLINLHSPLSIVTNYKLLNNLFYDRIDLGLPYSLTDVDYINQLGTMDISGDNKALLYEERTRMIRNLMYNEEDNF
ncbi:MAG: LLM class flavin-dependent oxidoreductase [Aequorivita sp.]